MAKFQRKPVVDDVDAVRLDPSTGDLDVGGVTAQAGKWLVKHADGSLSVEADDVFTDLYEIVETVAETVAADTEPAPEPPFDPQAAPVTV
jgi:hypothetical protein